MRVFLLCPASEIYEEKKKKTTRYFKLVNSTIVSSVSQMIAAILVCHRGNLIGYFLTQIIS